MVKWAIAVLVLIAVALDVRGEVRVLASVDRKALSMNETLALDVTIEGVQQSAEPKFLGLDGFSVLQAPGSSSQMSIVNGAMSSSLTYNYALGPKSVGKHKIGPIEVEVGGKTYRTEAIEVEVTKVPSPQPTGATGQGGQPAAQTAQDVVVMLQADKTNVYRNDQIMLSLTVLYRGVEIRALEPQNLPTKLGRLAQLGDRRVKTTLNGVEYDGYQYLMVLVPYRAGAIVIEPIPVKVQIVQRVARQRRGGVDDGFFGDDLFDQLVGRVRVTERVLQTDPLPLEVKPLPEAGRPASFNGAVGTFLIKATVSSNTVQAGSPVTLTAELSGIGDIDAVSLPLVTNVPMFRVYDAETSDKQNSVADGKLGGRKVYKQMWIPLSEKVKELPRIAFSYFDPAREQYVEITQGPFPLSVTPAPQGASLISDYRTTISKSGPLTILSQDILDIKKKPGELGIARRAFSSNLFLVAMSLPPILALALGVVARRRRRLRTDTAFYRRTTAAGRVNERLHAAKVALRKNQGTQFYSALSDAVCCFVADQLHLSAPQITAGSVGSILGGTSVPQETIEKVAALLGEFDFGRFASKAFDQRAARDQYGRTELVLRRLRRELR